MVAWAVHVLGRFQRTAEFLTGSAPVRKFSVLPHGKTGFTDRISLGKQFGTFRIAFVWLEAVCTPSLQSLSALGWLSGLNLLERKDLGLFCDVLAETGVESSPMKEVSMIPFAARERTCDCMIEERIE